MGYDVVHGGTHAIDFLTDKNRWQPPETTVAATARPAVLRRDRLRRPDRSEDGPDPGAR